MIIFLNNKCNTLILNYINILHRKTIQSSVILEVQKQYHSEFVKSVKQESKVKTAITAKST